MIKHDTQRCFFRQRNNNNACVRSMWLERIHSCLGLCPESRDVFWYMAICRMFHRRLSTEYSQFCVGGERHGSSQSPHKRVSARPWRREGIGDKGVSRARRLGHYYATGRYYGCYNVLRPPRHLADTQSKRGGEGRTCRKFDNVSNTCRWRQPPLSPSWVTTTLRVSSFVGLTDWVDRMSGGGGWRGRQRPTFRTNSSRKFGNGL